MLNYSKNDINAKNSNNAEISKNDKLTKSLNEENKKKWTKTQN